MNSDRRQAQRALAAAHPARVVQGPLFSVPNCMISSTATGGSIIYGVIGDGARPGWRSCAMWCSCLQNHTNTCDCIHARSMYHTSMLYSSHARVLASAPAACSAHMYICIYTHRHTQTVTSSTHVSVCRLAACYTQNRYTQTVTRKRSCLRSCPV
jgi:hypothetical protein